MVKEKIIYINSNDFKKEGEIMVSTMVMVAMLLLTVYTKLPDVFGPILKVVFGSANLPAGSAMDVFAEILHQISALPVFNFIDGILGYSFS